MQYKLQYLRFVLSSNNSRWFLLPYHLEGSSITQPMNPLILVLMLSAVLTVPLGLSSGLRSASNLTQTLISLAWI